MFGVYGTDNVAGRGIPESEGDSRLTLGKELFKETHMPTKQETLFGKGHLSGEQQGKGTQRTSLPHCLRFYGDEISF